MNRSLFTNVSTTKANYEEVKGFLMNLKKSLKWDSDISIVEATEHGFHITRTNRTLNNSEDIKVIEETIQ